MSHLGHNDLRRETGEIDESVSYITNANSNWFAYRYNMYTNHYCNEITKYNSYFTE